MSQDHFNLLFLSSRNTARSIFAESVTNRLGRGKFTGFSAGMKPAEAVDPMVLDILRLSKYSAEGLHPKSWAEFTQADAPPLDFVFTLCDLEAGEPPPRWPGRPITADSAARRGLGAAQAVERDARRPRATARRFYAAAVPHARPDQPAFAAGGAPPGRRGSLTCTRQAIGAPRPLAMADGCTRVRFWHQADVVSVNTDVRSR